MLFTGVKKKGGRANQINSDKDENSSFPGGGCRNLQPRFALKISEHKHINAQKTLSRHVTVLTEVLKALFLRPKDSPINAL